MPASADPSRQGAGPPSGATGPASLDPRSPSFFVPFGIGVVLMALAYFGIKGIESSTGPWAIQAAQRGIAGSGLPAADRAALTLQIERLATGIDSGALDAQSAVDGVDGLLKDPLIQLLLLEDVRRTRLPESGLTDEEKAAGAATLEELMTLVHANLVDGAQANDVLGPLREVSESGAPAQLDDPALRALLGRALRKSAGVDTKLKDAADLAPVNRATLLDGYRGRIDEIVGVRVPARGDASSVSEPAPGPKR